MDREKLFNRLGAMPALESDFAALTATGGDDIRSAAPAAADNRLPLTLFPRTRYFPRGSLVLREGPGVSPSGQIELPGNSEAILDPAEAAAEAMVADPHQRLAAIGQPSP